MEPRWFAGSCPDSHSGGGTGFGAGSGPGGAAFVAVEGLARTGITDSSLARGLLRLAAAVDGLHQLGGGDPGGV